MHVQNMNIWFPTLCIENMSAKCQLYYLRVEQRSFCTIYSEDYMLNLQQRAIPDTKDSRNINSSCFLYLQREQNIEVIKI